MARAKWALIAPQAPERLIGPGSPSFRCVPDTCDAMCCRSPYLAGMSERDVALLNQAGHQTLDFLDIDPSDLQDLLGQGLRWSQIITLRHEDDSCVFLQDGRSCGVYANRPDGCMLYPYRFVFVPREGDQIATHVDGVELLDRSVRIALGWESGEPDFIPLMLRDMSCPGFTEDPLDPSGYHDLLESLWAVDACTNHARPCDRHGALA